MSQDKGLKVQSIKGYIMENSHRPSYSPDAGEVLRFQLHRSITILFKNYLIMLEDLGIEHDTALNKLYDALPQEYKVYVDLADYLDEDKGKALRSKVLGAGNDALRNVDELLKQFEIEFKN